MNNCTIDEHTEIFNEITRELDKYILYTNLPYCHGTYIMKWVYDNDHTWCIRFPGATRGCITVNDDMIIEDIKLYDDTAFDLKGVACYKKEAKDALVKFIGTKLIIEGKEN